MTASRRGIQSKASGAAFYRLPHYRCCGSRPTGIGAAERDARHGTGDARKGANSRATRDAVRCGTYGHAVAGAVTGHGLRRPSKGNQRKNEEDGRCGGPCLPTNGAYRRQGTAARRPKRRRMHGGVLRTKRGPPLAGPRTRVQSCHAKRRDQADVPRAGGASRRAWNVVCGVGMGATPPCGTESKSRECDPGPPAGGPRPGDESGKGKGRAGLGRPVVEIRPALHQRLRGRWASFLAR